jgi:hypothetical protein
MVGCLLWIVLCVVGPELVQVKELARHSNNPTLLHLLSVCPQNAYGFDEANGGMDGEEFKGRTGAKSVCVVHTKAVPLSSNSYSLEAWLLARQFCYGNIRKP